MIDEAAAQLSPEFKQAHPDIPWSRMGAMRNRLIHAYFNVNLDIVWFTCVAGLPPLVAWLKSRGIAPK